MSSSNNTQISWWESKPSAELGGSTLISITENLDQDSQLLCVASKGTWKFLLLTVGFTFGSNYLVLVLIGAISTNVWAKARGWNASLSPPVSGHSCLCAHSHRPSLPSTPDPYLQIISHQRPHCKVVQDPGLQSSAPQGPKFKCFIVF